MNENNENIIPPKLELSDSCDLLIIMTVGKNCDNDSIQSYYHDLEIFTYDFLWCLEA